MIPTEDNYIDWILLGINDYFIRINYNILTFSIGQVKEHKCPIDRILAIRNKIIGLNLNVLPQKRNRGDMKLHRINI